MSQKVYPKCLEALLGGDIDIDLDEIRAVIVDVADYTYSDSHEFLSSVAAGARVATSPALASKTKALGVFSAAATTVLSVTGDQSEAVIIYKHTGSDATARLMAYLDGKIDVTCAVAASTSDTSVKVDPLADALPSGATLVFGAVTATLTAPASAGARSVTVSALSGGIAAGTVAVGTLAGTGFPITPDGGNIAINWSASGIFSI